MEKYRNLCGMENEVSGKKVSWSSEAESYLLENYEKMQIGDIADKLGRDIGAVKAKLAKLKHIKTNGPIKKQRLIKMPEECISLKKDVFKMALKELKGAATYGRNGWMLDGRPVRIQEILEASGIEYERRW